MSSNLRSTNRPADYDGSAPNVEPKKVEKADTPVFAQVKLKSVNRPADYDGKEPNVQFKKSEQADNTQDGFNAVKLKKVAQP